MCVRGYGFDEASSLDFSVIVVNYHGAEVLLPCVRSILQSEATSLLREVIVVDNSSGDAVLGEAERLSPLVRVERLATNIGFGAAANHGARLATGSSVVLMNNDTLVPSRWLEAFAETMERYGGRLLLCPLLVYASDPSRINSSGTFVTPLGTMGARRKSQPADEVNADEEVLAPSGACLASPQRLFLELGGYDESLFMYCEDLDLGWRARMAGVPVVLCARVRVAHRTGEDEPRSPLYYTYSLRNRIIVIRKNARPWLRMRLLMPGLVVALVTAVLVAHRRKIPLADLLRAVLEGLARRVSPSPKAGESRRGALLGWRETFTHSLEQARIHLG